MLFSVLFALTVANAQEDVTDKLSYFYLEAQCEACKLETQNQITNHYIISEAIFRDKLDEQKIDEYVAVFKSKLKAFFSTPEALLKQVVLRKLDSREDIEQSMKRDLDKYGGRTYEIKTVFLID